MLVQVLAPASDPEWDRVSGPVLVQEWARVLVQVLAPASDPEWDRVSDPVLVQERARVLVRASVRTMLEILVEGMAGMVGREGTAGKVGMGAETNRPCLDKVSWEE